MARRSSDLQRKVYLLPPELVERISLLQRDRGHSSEVETVRYLLTVALNNFDTPATLLDRMNGALKRLPPAEVAYEVLARHPLVTKIAFLGGDGIEFELVDLSHGGSRYKIDERRHVLMEDDGGWKPIDPSTGRISEKKDSNEALPRVRARG